MHVLQHGHMLLDERRFETRHGAPPFSRLPITHQQEVRSTSVQRRSGAELQLLYSCPWLRFHFGGQVVSCDRAILSTPHRKPPATASPAGLHRYASALRWCSFEACTVCAACGRTTEGRDGTSPLQRQTQTQTRGRATTAWARGVHAATVQNPAAVCLSCLECGGRCGISGKIKYELRD